MGPRLNRAPDPLSRERRDTADVRESAADYADLHARITGRLRATQSPNLYWATPRDAAFEAQRPFTI